MNRTIATDVIVALFIFIKLICSNFHRRRGVRSYRRYGVCLIGIAGVGTTGVIHINSPIAIVIRTVAALGVRSNRNRGDCYSHFPGRSLTVAGTVYCVSVNAGGRPG